MIKTTTEVSFDPINLTKQSIVFAQIKQALRDDISENYTLLIEEWVNVEYTEMVPVEGETELQEQTFTKKQIVRNHSRTMSFADADNLTAFLDANFEITQAGSARRKQYTILGHLIINNQETVRNTEWELA